MTPPDPELQALLDRLLSLKSNFDYSPLLINVPNEGETEALFGDLCERALDHNVNHDCSIMCEAIKGHQGLASAFLGFIYTAAERLRETGDIRWLKAGAGASLLQAGYPDYRDYLLAMAELYVTAEEAGIDPGPVFALIGYDEKDDFGKYTVVASRRRRQP